jgi:hypothetical protein
MRRILYCSLAAFCILALSACSAVKTGTDAGLHELVAGRSYTLTVKSDVPQLESKTLHTMAVEELGALLPIGADAPVAGEVQVRFSAQRVLSDPNVQYGVTGAMDTMGGLSNTAGTTASAPRSYLNGTLLVAVRAESGKILWHADYEHNGRFSLAATPEEVARLSFKRVVDALRKQMEEAGIAPPKGGKP